ncbi:MAG: protein kinase [Bryobacteraceae bacterium]
MERIGRYQIVGELGRGAMGVVYRAIDPAIGRTVAIKVIRLSEFTAPGERDRVRERLFREAQSAGILSHPGIVTIYDIAEEGDITCIFMECVNGPTFEKLLAAETPPSNDLIQNVFRQTAAALDYAHGRGIVHRDIKPANIMIHEDGRVKITDFGVAKIASQQMTQSGAMMGTPNYMSPEQIQSTPVDGRADQFSLAVIAYETLTGEKPFVAEPLAALLYKIVREDPVPTHLLNPVLDPKVDAVLRKALSKDRAGRYATCTQFVAAIEEACDARPGWHALRRGSSATLPTLMDAQAVPPRAPEPPVPAAAPSEPPPPIRIASEEASTRHRRPRYGDEEPLPPRRMGWLSTLGAVLLGVAIVGGVFYGTAKYLEQGTPAATPDASVQQQAQQPQSSAPQTAPAPGNAASEPAKPSPMSPAPEQEEPKPVAPAQPQIPATSPARPPKVEPAAPAEQVVLIRSMPPGARVVVDERPDWTCSTPCSLTLPHGRHALSATLQGYNTGMRVFEVPKESGLFMSLARAGGTLIVKTTPPGATIFINGQARPEKTPAMVPLAPGRYKLSVSLAGYNNDYQDITVRDGATLEANFTLGR